MKKLNFLVTFNLFWFSTFVLGDECQVWFDQKNLKQGEDCLVECSIAETDMGTFHCSERCDELCKKQPANPFYLTLSRIYPTLTEAEKNLVAKYPKEMLTAYKINWKSEKLCLTVFDSSNTNDESDACRHFVGAALLYEEFGLKFSQQILDAHEENPRQPHKEKLMDLTNNRLGLSVAIHLKETNKLTEKEILKSFQENLARGNLVIINANIQKTPKKSNTEKNSENTERKKQKEER